VAGTDTGRRSAARPDRRPVAERVPPANRLTPSMCQEPSSCSNALARPDVTVHHRA
jgi:hypothetical protein